MVLEVVDIRVTPGRAGEFVTAYRSVLDVLITTPGCQRATMNHSVESPNRFVLLVEWDSIEAHVENFRQTERLPRWRAAVTEFFAEAPRMEHMLEVT